MRGFVGCANVPDTLEGVSVTRWNRTTDEPHFLGVTLLHSLLFGGFQHLGHSVKNTQCRPSGIPGILKYFQWLDSTRQAQHPTVLQINRYCLRGIIHVLLSLLMYREIKVAQAKPNRNIHAKLLNQNSSSTVTRFSLMSRTSPIHDQRNDLSIIPIPSPGTRVNHVPLRFVCPSPIRTRPDSAQHDVTFHGDTIFSATIIMIMSIMMAHRISPINHSFLFFSTLLSPWDILTPRIVHDPLSIL